ncbi:alpha/beta hydrolase [Paenibacillus sp. Soil750]|uniref:alpha/beta hydrolase n=1 Tax=Paenibacillus sp. Soil750 TaxID=1736398 RepID=UPI003FA72857
MRDLSRAMIIIREHAEQWRINPDHIAICGFSAGGHLAASLAVHWNTPGYQRYPGVFQQAKCRHFGLPRHHDRGVRTYGIVLQSAW